MYQLSENKCQTSSWIQTVATTCQLSSCSCHTHCRPANRLRIPHLLLPRSKEISCPKQAPLLALYFLSSGRHSNEMRQRETVVWITHQRLFLTRKGNNSNSATLHFRSSILHTSIIKELSFSMGLLSTSTPVFKPGNSSNLRTCHVLPHIANPANFIFNAFRVVLIVSNRSVRVTS